MRAIGSRFKLRLRQPENKLPVDKIKCTAAVATSSLPMRAIARGLSAKGYAALSTRQHDEHANTDYLFDVRRDNEAAVTTVKLLGYCSIVLQGRSLGTV
jgi:hypothetical protein